MTSTPCSQRLPRGFIQLSSDSFQLGNANLSSTIGFRPVHLVDETLYISLLEYPSRQSLAFVRNTHHAAEMTGREEPSNVENPPAIGQLVPTDNSELLGPLEPPFNNPWVDVATEFVVASRTVAERELGLEKERAAGIRSKLVKALVGGVLSLIVVPGIVLGVLVNAMAGFALSSAITGLANLLAGLFYYLHKRE